MLPLTSAQGDNPDFLDIAKVSCYGEGGGCQLTKTLDVELTAAPIAWDKAHPGQLSKVALVVSGIPFQDVTARAVQVNTKVLRFRLDPNVNADRWKELFVELAMPDFNGLLLGLLGVSNGTYVGLKLKAS